MRASSSWQPESNWRNAPNPYRGMQAQQIHTKLRDALLPKFPWLSQPATARISARERSADFLRLFGFLAVVLFVLSIPGLLLLVFLKAFLPGSGPGPLLLLWSCLHWPRTGFTSGGRRVVAKPRRPSLAG